MNALSSDELLFFGAATVNFAGHPGTVQFMDNYSFHEEHSRTDHDPFVSHIAATRAPSTKNEDWQQLELPNMPTTFIQTEKKLHNEHRTTDSFDELSRPLIKTTEPSRLTGLISGVRSALIKTMRSKWYRLKGCGNNTDGFLIEPVANSKGKLTIRGCAFLHTTYRELYMTKMISDILTPHQIVCANIPIGWFEYGSANEHSDNESHLDLPIVVDRALHRWPEIVRVCIVMETLANKRLSDHVLHGIEQLFDSIISDHNLHPIDLPSLLTSFPSHRLTQSEQNCDQLIPLPTWSVSLDSNLGPLASHQSAWLSASAHISNKVPPHIDPRWKALWQVNVEMINQYLQTNTLSHLLCLLYRRIGFECGSILGLMHHHRISWGTYTDALGTHCNAHLNNMVIKLPSDILHSHNFFLAPLDFDMSFTEASCLQSFDELISMELLGFRMALGGDADVNSGMTALADMPDIQSTSARWFLRDMLLNSFDITYNEVVRTGSIKSSHVFSDEQMRSMYSLIRLALIQTMNESG